MLPLLFAALPVRTAFLSTNHDGRTLFASIMLTPPHPTPSPTHDFSNCPFLQHLLASSVRACTKPLEFPIPSLVKAETVMLNKVYTVRLVRTTEVFAPQIIVRRMAEALWEGVKVTS